MTFKRFVAAAVGAAVIAGTLPAKAFASEETPTNTKAAVVDMRGAVDRAATRMATEHRAPSTVSVASAYGEAAAQSNGGGGGGGKTMLIVTLLSTAAGLGVTYYTIKQLKKQTGQ